MIIIRMLRVGLGNQLFEYAYGRYLAQKYNQELCIYFPSKMDHGYTFENGLGQLSLNIDKKINWIQMTFLSRGRNILHFIYMLKEFIFHKEERINLYLEETKGKELAAKGIIINYDGTNEKDYFDEIRKVTYARGYFQFPKYAYENKTELMLLLKFQNEKVKKYKNIIDLMCLSKSVAIHIRRGDYLSNKNYDVCNEDYYLKAINKIKTLFLHPTFFVFTDDCDYVKSKISWFKNSTVYFIQDLMERIDSVDELRLMGYCKHFIISNSTYSWWGQFAGTNEQKTVIAPNKWYVLGEKVMFYENNWYLIEC